MVFIDVHSHLDICRDVDKIIQNARKLNVKVILACGVNSKTNREVLKLSKKYPEVKACLGIYPIDALKISNEKINSEIEFIRKNKSKIVAISEIGLDLKQAPEKTFLKQKKNLLKFIELSQKLDVPLIVHSRKAEQQTIELLESSNYKKIIMHCFSGKLKLVKRIIDNDWFLSIPTCVKHSEHFQKIIELAPITRFFCETDSPFLHPDKLQNNEPANVIESYKAIARIKGLKLTQVEKQIEKNYMELFAEV
ncbi:MAG: TatD family hydrolase [Nanoarchaeota archaeon]|nr:TatD family hydrolase [Nanoarchaeota archaeon]MBU4116919.1 TatD family hydrolase [Nanoarchaeota archaeon]